MSMEVVVPAAYLLILILILNATPTMQHDPLLNEKAKILKIGNIEKEYSSNRHSFNLVKDWL